MIPAPLAKALGWGALYALLIAVSFTFPLMPSAELDPSWRMALGYFFNHGMQFGRDVIFTYGPLGFLMGKTFSGLQFWSLLVGQGVLAVIAATVILWQGRRLDGSSRIIYFAFFLLFGTTYEDALHMLVIGILGFELLRNGHAPWKHRTAVIAVVLAFYGQIKFTDFLLGLIAVTIAAAYGIWRRRRRESALLVLWFLGAYLAIWVLCGQNLDNLPAYFSGSWQISDGYVWAMGFPSPEAPLWKALVILAALAGYGALHLFLNPDKPRAAANALFFGAFVFLNWKHGFVRADGHMIGFFYCALLPIIAYPTLLEDPPRLRVAHRWAFLGALLLSLWGLENALPGVVRESLGLFQAKAWGNLESVFRWQSFRQNYRDHLTVARQAADLAQTRELVGDATVDILGFEQGVALFNKFNYRPRPVIQSYSAYTPKLARLNGDFYASDRAPEFVLMKTQTIDGRLPTMDDSEVLLILAHRYDYLQTDRGFQLWKRSDRPFDRTTITPKPLRQATVELGTQLLFEDLSAQPLWLRVDLQPSFLGRLRSFFYKPPQVTLTIQDVAGNPRSYLMPLPQGRTGFILSPIVEDTVDYMHFASNRPEKAVRGITLSVAPADRKFFAPAARVEISGLPPAYSGLKYFTNINEKLFHMFKNYPVAFDSATGFSESMIDGKEVAVMHAPSQMVFDLPAGATIISGQFGMLEGTYTNGGKTNGAVFVVYWSNGSDRVDLFQKYLNPVSKFEDRGLHDFKAKLTGLTGGKLYLEVKPGPYNDHAWDWTAWTDIRIK
ncbi:MAG: DUF2029 domain-containing protein [Opitutae bacterium]|nr:DUF2029 domain-containing protein [Opitutae bacterium]